METAETSAAWPLVGREAEQARIEALLRGERPRGIVLVGPAGVGKTRVAREALEQARTAGLHCEWITASTSVQPAPFGALATLLPSVDPRGVRSSRSFGDLLRTSTRSLLERAGERQLALFVDDGHRLDEASAALVHQLAASAVASVIVTMRLGERVPVPLVALWKDDLAERITLPPLDDVRVGHLLATVLGGQVDPGMTVQLQGRAGGNVLFLRELVLGALEDGSLRCDRGVWQLVGLPHPSERLAELVDARLRDLEPELHATLQLVAFGEPLSGAALKQDERDAAERLESRGLIVSALDGRRLQIRMAHPLYGEVIRGRTPGLRWQAIAESLATGVESFGMRRREDPLRVGVWRLAGGGGNPDRLLAAAAAARAAYDFGLAERLATAAAEAGAGLRGQTLAAEMCALNGAPEEAERRLAELQAKARDDRQRVHLAIARLQIMWFMLARTEEGLALVDAAEATIDDPALRAELHAQKIGLLLSRHGPRATLVELSPFLDRPDDGPPWLSIIASFSLGRLGRLGEALDIADRGYRAANRQPQDRTWYPWFDLFVRCEALALAGRFGEADSLAREQYRRGLSGGSTEARAWFLWHQARTVHDRGHIDEALQQAREGLALIRQMARHGHEHDLLAALALAHALAGDADAAKAALTESDELAVAPRGWTGADLLIARGWTRAAEGAVAEARTVLRRAADHGRDVGDITGAAAALHGIARLGDPEEAVLDLEFLSRQIDGVLATARLQHVRALVSADADELSRVSSIFAGMGAHLLAAEAMADVAVALARAKAPGANGARHRAALLNEHCGGARTPALRSIDARAGLTDAERETALLAAAGLSDAEIAERLQISVRTAGNRLHRAYAKLDIPGRSSLRAVFD